MVKGIYTWKEINGLFLTPGGDPCYICPNCGGDAHVYGVECLETFHHECKECKTQLRYPWESTNN